MSSCLTLTSGICRGCMDNVGGIKKLYIIELDEIDFDNDITVSTDGSITNIGASTLKWYVFQPNKNSSNFAETINSSVENGTIYYEQVVTAVFGKNEQRKRNVIAELGKGETVCLVVDSNGKYWLVGEKDNGCTLGGSFTTGTTKADGNQWSVTLTVQANAPAIEVIPSAGSQLETDLATADAAC